MKQYKYVGSRDLLETLPNSSNRLEVSKVDDMLQWLNENPQPREYDNSIVLTFIIALNGKLWINERRSEHVLCANKADVLSAGEITFMPENGELIVSEVTNQSTGYCPEPESWVAVENALNTLGISHPEFFTSAYLFRRCENCHSTNIVKDEWFYCAVCDAELPQEWNFSA